MDSKTDQLYQLPLEEFTNARNALAKTLAGDEKRAVAALVKPTAPVWAINQLYWKDRSTYKALVDASERLRSAHRAVLGGKKVDVHKPDQVHRAALERAVSKTIALFEGASGRISDAARDAIRRTLAALPTDEQEGRLTREPEAAGFSLFEGVKPRAAHIGARRTKEEQKAEATAAEKKRESDARKAAEREERERATRAEAARKELAKLRAAAERASFNVRKAETALEEAKASEAKAIKAVKEAEASDDLAI
jgi:hypothetical protein